jgi:hypothetical protein
VCVCIYIYIYIYILYIHGLPIVIYAVHVDQTRSSLKMAETLYNIINILQLIGSEICVYFSVKYVRMLW